MVGLVKDILERGIRTAFCAMKARGCYSESVTNIRATYAEDLVPAPSPSIEKP